MTEFLASARSGYFACLTVMLIWVLWLLVSRIGANSSLTVYDLAAMRYGISAVVSLPFVIYFKAWNSLPAKRALILSIVLGPLYIVTVFSGFIYAPAAHGGIFMNGLVPIFTIFIAWFLPLLLLTIFRPNLEDRVAQSRLSRGWWLEQRLAKQAAEQSN